MDSGDSEDNVDSEDSGDNWTVKMVWTVWIVRTVWMVWTVGTVEMVPTEVIWTLDKAQKMPQGSACPLVGQGLRRGLG